MFSFNGAIDLFSFGLQLNGGQDRFVSDLRYPAIFLATQLRNFICDSLLAAEKKNTDSIEK